MSNGNGHHWSKFCWRDWRSDGALHPCSLAAKGFWIEMLCLMHEGEPIGHLTLGNKPATLRQLAANAYCSEKEAAKYLAELEEAGVFSRTDGGTIYSRRMVKDAAASEVGREHIKKRWNGHKSEERPNSPPNRVPSRNADRSASRDPITKTSESEKILSKSREEKEAAPAREAPISGILGQTIVDLAKSLKTKPPPFTPSVVYQLSALEPAKPRPQPQDMPMTPEQQLEALHRMMAEEEAKKPRPENAYRLPVATTGD